ncbi:MAG: hypothetical protein ABTS16_09205 [Candidatus Accumulibacter phosphatis]|uniref:hypothetical protein n=1 Tax=Candidatus Accumulibacter contiguus TaxID=2954381 RepID=UPI00145D0945|nr:hypothetical protein [Candidatus Accumulibacter contiguus]
MLGIASQPALRQPGTALQKCLKYRIVTALGTFQKQFAKADQWNPTVFPVQQ